MMEAKGFEEERERVEGGSRRNVLKFSRGLLGKMKGIIVIWT